MFEWINCGPDFEDRTGHVYEDIQTKEKFGITKGTNLFRHNVYMGPSGGLMMMHGKPKEDDIGGPYTFLSNYDRDWLVNHCFDEAGNVLPWENKPGAMGCQPWCNEYLIQRFLHEGKIKRVK